MATFPNEQRQYVQENRGQFSGNTFATYGIDLTTEKGLARVSEPSLQAITSDDDSSYNRYAGAIFEYDGSYIAMSDKAFSSSTATGNVLAKYECTQRTCASSHCTSERPTSLTQAY